jgi:hypothetical protein
LAAESDVEGWAGFRFTRHAVERFIVRYGYGSARLIREASIAADMLTLAAMEIDAGRGLLVRWRRQADAEYLVKIRWGQRWWMIRLVYDIAARRIITVTPLQPLWFFDGNPRREAWILLGITKEWARETSGDGRPPEGGWSYRPEAGAPDVCGPSAFCGLWTGWQRMSELLAGESREAKPEGLERPGRELGAVAEADADDDGEVFLAACAGVQVLRRR